MKTQSLLVVACLLAGSNAVAATPLDVRFDAGVTTTAPQLTPCQITFQKIKELQKKNGEVCFMMSTLHANKKDAGTDPWVGYTDGYLDKNLSKQEAQTVFSTRINNHENICKQGKQGFNCNKTVTTDVSLEGPNKLHVTFHWTSGPGEQHDFEMTCKEDFMFGVSKQNASLAAAFRVTSETCDPPPVVE